MLYYYYIQNRNFENIYLFLCGFKQGTKPLTWSTRFKIATGSARGLQFLHGMDKPLIHGDIKRYNT